MIVPERKWCVLPNKRLQSRIVVFNWWVAWTELVKEAPGFHSYVARTPTRLSSFPIIHDYTRGSSHVIWSTMSGTQQTGRLEWRVPTRAHGGRC